MNKQQILANATLEILNDVYVFNDARATCDNINNLVNEKPTKLSRIEFYLLDGLRKVDNQGEIMHKVVTEINKMSSIVRPKSV